MKSTVLKFSVVPSYRKLCIGAFGALTTLAGSSAFADGTDLSTSANTSISSAQTQGLSVGGTVVACVAALCVVGVIISMIRKV